MPIKTAETMMNSGKNRAPLATGIVLTIRPVAKNMMTPTAVAARRQLTSTDFTARPYDRMIRKYRAVTGKYRPSFPYTIDDASPTMRKLPMNVGEPGRLA